MSFEDQLGGKAAAPRPKPAVARPSAPASLVDAEAGAALSRYKEDVTTFAQTVTSIEQSLKVVGTPRDSQEVRTKLNQNVKAAQQQMKLLMEVTRRLNSQGGPRQQQRQRITEDFYKWSQKLQQLSKDAAQKEHTPVPQAPKPKASAASAIDDEAPEKQGLLEAARRAQMEQIESERMILDIVSTEREEAIKQIESSVVQVNEMFTDLASLVAEQGVMIDNIEHNVIVAEDNVDKGVTELKTAAKYERKTRGKMCCIAITAVVFLAIVVVIIVVPSVLYS